MVAEMAPRPAQPIPEDQGIGQLPAGNMNFADGGIIAFADGGDVERYQSQGLVQDPQLASLLAARERYLRAGSDTSGIDQAIAFIQAKSSQGAAQKPPASAELPMGGGFAEQMMQGIAAPAPIAPQATMPEAGYTRPGMKDDPRRNTPRSVPFVAAPTAATGRKNTAPKEPAAAKLPGQADLATLYQDILGKQNFQDPAAEASLQLEAQERANAAADRQAIAQDAERFKDAYKGREGRLAEREADIGKQKGTNTGLAFLNAGLAIMSTPGGLASAIGKGAQVGTAQFAAGLDKIRSAQERLGEARDRLEDLKLNREDVSAKDLREADRRYREVAVTAQKRTIDGVRQAAGVNEARAKNIYDKTVDMTKTVYEQEQQNKRSAGQIAATLQSPERMAYMSALEKTKTKENPQGDPAAAYQSIVAMKADPRSQEKLRGDWLDMAKRMQIQADYPNIKTFEDYMTVFGGGTGSAGGAGGGFKVVGVR
jgi:hypothetical protein